MPTTPALDTPSPNTTLQRRLELLKRFSEGNGVVWHAPRMTDDELKLFGVQSSAAFVSRLIFMESELPATEDLVAAYNGLNLQLNRTWGEIDRHEVFLRDTYQRVWTGVEHLRLLQMEARGFLVLATVFDVMGRYYAALDDGT